MIKSHKNITIRLQNTVLSGQHYLSRFYSLKYPSSQLNKLENKSKKTKEHKKIMKTENRALLWSKIFESNFMIVRRKKRRKNK